MKWSDKKVLVTGGAGFIGQNLVKQLLAYKADVFIIDNFSFAPKTNIPQGCTLIEGDVRSTSLIRKLPKKINFIFHFGAPSSIILFKRNPIECLDITINGFKNMLDYGIKLQAQKVIYPSSGSIYWKEVTVNKIRIPQPINMYGKTKQVCETIANIYKDIIPSTGFRIFAGYGPGEKHKKDFASVITLFINMLLKNERPVLFGDGSQKRDFVYIEDIISSIFKVLELNINEDVIDIGEGKAYTFNELITFLNKLLGKSIKPQYIQKPMDYLEQTKADTSKMKKLLKISPIPLRDGLQRYINYLKN